MYEIIKTDGSIKERTKYNMPYPFNELEPGEYFEVLEEYKSLFENMAYDHTKRRKKIYALEEFGNNQWRVICTGYYISRKFRNINIITK